MYHLIGDHERIHAAMRIWRERMTADAQGNVILPDLGIWGRVDDQPSITDGRTDRFLTHFRVQAAP
jgi:hypothetical protein